jgi:lauroyl/myristoyl acyltransferase
MTDFGKLAVTLGLGGVAAILPRRAHRTLADGLLAVGSRVRRGDLERAAALLGERLPEITHDERMAIAAEMRAVRIEHALCRGYGIFRRDWPARLDVTGLEHLHAAHAQGRGAVVWMMSFLDATPFNVVAAAAGYPVTHLSAVNHGLSGRGRISLRVVAPIVLRGERRSQARRVVIPPDGGMGYLRDLLTVVERDHGMVSIRGDYSFGRRLIEAPHLGRTVRFPTGAPSLAHRTGAPLLSTATIRRGPLHHEVVIDPPIAVSRDLSRNDFQAAAVAEFASRLASRARAHPGSQPWLPFVQAGSA